MAYIKNYLFLVIFFLNLNELFPSEYWEKLEFLSQDTIYTASTSSSGDIFVGTLKEGIYRTTDFGKSWEQINNNIEGSSIQLIQINLSKEIFIFSRGYGLYKSSDNGESWIQINFNLREFSFARFLAVDKNNKLYLSIQDSVYYLEKDSEFWVNITPKSDYHQAFVNIGIDNKNNVYLIGKGQYSTLFRLKNGSSSWDSLSLSVLDVWNIYSLVFNSNNDIIFSSLSDGIIRSTDNGDTFEKFNTNLDTTSIRTLVINEYNHIYGVFSRKGIYRSIDNGETWIKIFDYNDNISISKIIYDNVGYLLGMTLDAGIYRSTEPLEVQYINTQFSIDTIPIIDYLDTLTIGIGVVDSKSKNALKEVVINVIDSLTNNNIILRSDSTGIANYQLIVPENIDTGLYTISFICSKFAYRNDTTTFQVYVMHEVVSVEDNEYVTDIRINPNPSTGEFYFQFNIIKSNNIFYTINDCIGREIYNSKIQYYDKGDYNIKLDILNNQPSGYYYLKFNVGNLVSTIPIIIMK